jgi:hypothetical protein
LVAKRKSKKRGKAQEDERMRLLELSKDPQAAEMERVRLEASLLKLSEDIEKAASERSELWKAMHDVRAKKAAALAERRRKIAQGKNPGLEARKARLRAAKAAKANAEKIRAQKEEDAYTEREKRKAAVQKKLTKQLRHTLQTVEKKTAICERAYSELREKVIPVITQCIGGDEGSLFPHMEVVATNPGRAGLPGLLAVFTRSVKADAEANERKILNAVLLKSSIDSEMKIETPGKTIAEVDIDAPTKLTDQAAKLLQAKDAGPKQASNNQPGITELQLIWRKLKAEARNLQAQHDQLVLQKSHAEDPSIYGLQARLRDVREDAKTLDRKSEAAALKLSEGALAIKLCEGRINVMEKFMRKCIAQIAAEGAAKQAVEARISVVKQLMAKERVAQTMKRKDMADSEIRIGREQHNLTILEEQLRIMDERFLTFRSKLAFNAQNLERIMQRKENEVNDLRRDWAAALSIPMKNLVAAFYSITGRKGGRAETAAKALRREIEEVGTVATANLRAWEASCAGGGGLFGGIGSAESSSDLLPPLPSNSLANRLFPPPKETASVQSSARSDAAGGEARLPSRRKHETGEGEEERESDDESSIEPWSSKSVRTLVAEHRFRLRPNQE